MKRIYLIVAAIFLIGFAMLGVNDINTKENKIQLKEVQLQDTSAELKRLQLRYELLNTELQNVDRSNKEQIQKLEDEKKHLENEKQRLEAEVQAKAEAKRVAAQRVQQAAQSVSVTQRASAAPQGVTGCGSDPDQQFIYQRESGCRTNAINASSGACGLGQALPCGKMGCSLSDWNCQNNWFTGYMRQRYGSWANARAFWERNLWW